MADDDGDDNDDDDDNFENFQPVDRPPMKLLRANPGFDATTTTMDHPWILVALNGLA